MTKYETLLKEYDHLDIQEKPMKNEGLYCDGSIWINKSLIESKKACILAEEIGHYETSFGDIANKKDMTSVKQEYVARKWAYNKLLPFEEVMAAIGCGFTKPHEIAEHLCVDEAFLRECLKYYRLL